MSDTYPKHVIYQIKKALIDSGGSGQKRIAERLGVPASLVSQVNNRSRGHNSPNPYGWREYQANRAREFSKKEISTPNVSKSRDYTYIPMKLMSEHIFNQLLGPEICGDLRIVSRGGRLFP